MWNVVSVQVTLITISMSQTTFHFSLDAHEVLELYRLFNIVEEGGTRLSDPLQHLRARIIDLAQTSSSTPTPRLPMTDRGPGFIRTHRFSPYALTATTHAAARLDRQNPSPQSRVASCLRGGTKKVRPTLRSWELTDEPHLESNNIAKEFLGSLMYRETSNVLNQACFTWVSGLAKSFQPCDPVEGSNTFSLRSVLRKCSESGSGTIRHLFLQVLSQIELAMTVDRCVTYRTADAFEEPLPV
jgi:hypothetical protein